MSDYEIDAKRLLHKTKQHPMTKKLAAYTYTLFCVATGMVGFTIHGSLGWSLINVLFSLFSWAKWLICHEVNVSIIKQTFSFIFN